MRISHFSGGFGKRGASVSTSLGAGVSGIIVAVVTVVTVVTPCVMPGQCSELRSVLEGWRWEQDVTMETQTLPAGFSSRRTAGTARLARDADRRHPLEELPTLSAGS